MAVIKSTRNGARASFYGQTFSDPRRNPLYMSVARSVTQEYYDSLNRKEKRLVNRYNKQLRSK